MNADRRLIAACKRVADEPTDAALANLAAILPTLPVDEQGRPELVLPPVRDDDD